LVKLAENTKSGINNAIKIAKEANEKNKRSINLNNENFS